MYPIDGTTPEGFTPLMLAAEKNGLRLARLLLSKGASASQKNIKGGTALMAAAHFGFREMTELLVEKVAGIHAADEIGVTALHLAAQGKHFSVARVLLDSGAHPTTRDNDGQTPLHLASGHGEVRIIELLINAGAEAGAAYGRYKNTPLVYAARLGHHDAVRFMISRFGLAGCGGEPAGALALELAADAGHIEVLRTLTSFGVQDTGGALVNASNNGNQDCVKLLLQQYEKQSLSHINTATDEHGRNALARAAANEIVQWLLDAGANPAEKLTVPGTRAVVTSLDCSAYTIFPSAQTEEAKQMLKATRRTLLQAPAIQSVSWGWGSGATTASTGLIMPTGPSAPTASAPPIAISVVRRGRRATSRVVLGGLMR